MAFAERKQEPNANTVKGWAWQLRRVVAALRPTAPQQSNRVRLRWFFKEFYGVEKNTADANRAYECFEAGWNAANADRRPSPTV